MPQSHRRIFRPVLVLLLMSLMALALVAARTLALAGLAAQPTPLFETVQAAQAPRVTLSPSAVTDATISSVFLAAPALPPANARHAVQSEALSAVQITLQPHGFEPAQLSRQRAPFLLILRNRSGLDETVLQVASTQGARMREVRLPHNRTKWSVRLDLPSGEYSLTEANHPDWIFRLSIR